ncbi:MAG: hypothetical protein NZM38_05445 [Cytophagales bacterium]|nr:hypothetical protein [Cytophagales bacterium]MDW8384199.1 hypothetical protein [Flammeovirgaceae bacterium]
MNYVKTYGWVLGIGLFTNLSLAQYFEPVSFIGAVGQNDWTLGWTDYAPNGTNYNIGTKKIVPLSGAIEKDLILYNSNVYLLKGPVFVRGGATLFIEPGTLIMGEQATAGALIITKGSKIIANGTREQPIIFTSAQPVGKRAPGDWGGVVILGDAQINIPAGELQMEGPGTLPKYGGKNDMDNSGILRYVRIEFAGRKFGPDKEMNGLSLCGVGNGTIVEYVMVSFSKDDAYEFYGGTVNCKYLISNRCGDDDFDLTQGYRGNIQFAIALRHNLISDVEGSRAVEADSYQDNSHKFMKLPTSAVISNLTVVSPEQVQGKYGNPKLDQVVKMYHGGVISVVNSLFIGFPIGFLIEGSDIAEYFNQEKIRIHNNILVGIKTPVESHDIDKRIFDFSSWFIEPARNNQILKSDQIPTIFQNPFTEKAPNFEINRRLSYTPSFNDLPTPPAVAQPFFVATNYLGALSASNNWLNNWTNLKPNSEDYPEADVVIKGEIKEDMVFAANKTYLLKGDVVVNDGVTVTFEPGVIVKGESQSVASLIISPEAKIIAEGTPNKPIVFTSDKPKGKRAKGDWAGIYILGKGRIYTEKPVMSAKEVEAWLPSTINLAGLQNLQDRGILKYVRIEFAGGLKKHEVKVQGKNSASEHTLAGIICAGVSNLNMSHIQVSISGNDGFEFIGGDVNAKYLFSYHSEDDDFSISHGYNGKIQFALIVRDPTRAAFDGAYAIEVSKYEHYKDYLNIPSFSNFTIIGPRFGNPTNVNQNYRTGVSASENGAFHFRNSVIAGYDNSINVSGNASTYFIKSGLGTFQNNIIAGSKPDAVFLRDGKPDKSMELAIIRNSSNKVSVLKTNEELQLDNSYIPGNKSPMLNVSFVE